MYQVLIDTRHYTWSKEGGIYLRTMTPFTLAKKANRLIIELMTVYTEIYSVLVKLVISVTNDDIGNQMNMRQTPLYKIQTK